MGTATAAELALQAEVRELRKRIALLENERQAVHHRAEEGRAKLEAALTSMTDAVFICDAEGRFIHTNNAFATYHRFKNKEECSKTFADCPSILDAFLPDGSPAPPDMWAVPRALRGETATNTEYTLHRKDTGETWVGSYSFGPIRGEDGAVLGAVVVARDITERRQAEEALRLQDERLLLALKGAELATWDWDISTGELVWSERCYALFGLAAGTRVDHESFLGALHPNDRDRVEGAIRSTLEKDLEYRVEIRTVWPDGSTHWIASRGRAFRDQSGGPVRMSGVAFDITERKDAEQLLVADLAALKRMHGLSTSRAGAAEFEQLLQGIMDAAVAVVGADRGTLQLIEDDSLRIVAHHGHQQPFLEFFASAEEHASVCGAAFRRGERVVVEDVECSQLFTGTPSLAVLREADVRAVQSTPLLSRSGKLLGILTTQWGFPYIPDEHDLWRIDLLARQAADLIEHACSEAEMRRLAQFPEQNPNPVLRIDESGGLLYANAPAREWLAAAGAIAGQPLPAGIQTLIAETRRQERSVQTEFRDGRGRTWWFVANRPGGERFVNLYGCDLTERKRAEEALADAVQRLNAHMDNSPLAVVEFDPQFRVTRWSREAERMFGWRAEEIVGRAIAEIPWVYVDDVELVRQVSQDMLDGKRTRNLSRNRNYRKDGSVVQCEWYNSAIYDNDGKLCSILSQVLDVTERKQSEERLRQAQKLESLGLLAGGVAHDFNNLLVGVIGNASLAQEILSPEHPAIELMQRVVKTGEQAAHLTRQMLAYSGKGHFLLEVLDISALVSEISDLIRPSISKKVALHLDLEQGLPSIEADRGQVQQILMNLVINAAEAMGGHDGVVTVRTGVQIVDDRYHRLHPETLDLREGVYLALEVRDTGCGMEEGVKARIFDPFFSTKFTGRGLGLAAVGGIVRGHKGAIIVSSEPDRGSSFTVLFPSAARPFEQRAAATSAVAQGSGVVLVVDDEQVVREMAKRALARHGYTVLLAHDGMAAIDLFKRYPGKIELVILDLSMPAMSGEETLHELRKIRTEAKVLVSSGYSEAEAMTIFHGQRLAGFLQKPYTSSAIAEKVKLALD